ncbi:MAG: biosynthetic arginine decarboxylase [Myxococcota bacterium]
MRGWTTDDSLSLYQVPQWGKDHFSINEAGHVCVQPRGPGGPELDLLAIVEDLEGQGYRTPLLLRFSDILESRLRALSGCFGRAIESHGYRGRYAPVYPIKVNQQRHVVEELVNLGAPLGVGLEAGSRPELLIALALLEDENAPIICNGYKDRAYVETALLAQKLGRHPILVIDRFRELDRVIQAARELGIRPHIGVRARLMARGAGKWVASTGDRAKFGLSPQEILAAVERLRGEGMLDCLELLHIHIGSQITSIRAHKEALREVSRVYVGLRDLGAPLGRLDVGGGLGVDYDGSQTNFHSSTDYSMQEYANDVVAAITEACDERDVPHPDLVSESGRALVAHHSVLVFDVLDVNEILRGGTPEPVLKQDPKVLHDLYEIWDRLNQKNVQECFHAALQAREEATTLFSMGFADLSVRGRVEKLFLQCCEKILHIVRNLDEVPEDLGKLEKDLADTYYGNFSVFQSAPDHWAVGQLFPVMPIHRLEEKPTRRGVIADLTCDSDGQINRFIDHRDVKDVLELHRLDSRPYYIGIFLIGAYQEILGDLHNLFGDTDAAHVSLNEDGSHRIEHVVGGDQVRDVLRYVQYDAKSLLEKIQGAIQRAQARGEIEADESERLTARFEQGLRDYTYLSRDD